MKQLTLWCLRWYQAYISLDRGVLGKVIPHQGKICRYDPTCSQYAIEAVERFGVSKGLWLAAKRISRCHPWGGWGYDPVPELKK